tara:strand:- start:743 stop:1123 length:381 start_codon:yes stop_codon:yes gene_type:complete
MSETNRSLIENINRTLWFSIKLEDIKYVNDSLQELNDEDKIDIKIVYSRKINNIMASIIEYANTRNGGRTVVVHAKRELSRLMKLDIDIDYSVPVLYERGIIDNDGINNFIDNAYESDKSIAYYSM